jgi:ribosomal-protein-alanine N-acetyltransferase
MPAPVQPAIQAEEWFRADDVGLRLLTLGDCSETYVAWLNDPEVIRYLETRWQPQTMETVVAFVRELLADPSSHLFAIIELPSGRHVGNLKIGPVDARHAYADVSYFIGDRSVWGRGYASQAIGLAAEVGFTRLGLHRLQAGVYEGNVPSARALARAGFREEGRMRRQLRGPDGWEDHVWYGLLIEEWQPGDGDTMATTTAGDAERGRSEGR